MHKRLPFLLLAAFALCSACVSSSYVAGPAQPRGSLTPIYVEFNEPGAPMAFGRRQPDAARLAKTLRSEKADLKNGRPVIIRCHRPELMGDAETLRRDLHRNGIANIAIQGPRTATATVAPGPSRLP